MIYSSFVIKFYSSCLVLDLSKQRKHIILTLAKLDGITYSILFSQTAMNWIFAKGTFHFNISFFMDW